MLLKSNKLQSRIASLNSSIASALLSSPPNFLFKFRISLKSPKYSHGSGDKPANLLKRVHVCFFWLILGCLYTHVPFHAFPWAFWTWKFMWCRLYDLIWTAMSVFHIIANPPLFPSLSTTKTFSIANWLQTFFTCPDFNLVSQRNINWGLCMWRIFFTARHVWGFSKPRTFQYMIFMADGGATP